MLILINYIYKDDNYIKNMFDDDGVLISAGDWNKKITAKENLIDKRNNPRPIKQYIKKINKKYEGSPTYEETENPHNVTPIKKDDSWINKNVSFH